MARTHRPEHVPGRRLARGDARNPRDVARLAARALTGLLLAAFALGSFAQARVSAQTPAAARSNAQGSPNALAPNVAKVLDEIKAADKDLLAVSEEDGRFLRLTAAAARATHALEIGGANGYSAIWIGLGLRQTGGTLTTIEYDPARAKSAADNIRRAGLSDIVTVVPGDAFQQIPKISGTFDFVFLDAWKRDYKRFFDMVFPRMTPGSLFLAHNVVNKASEMEDFLAAIQNNPQALTTIVKPGFEGMSVSLKLRSQ